MRIEEQLPRATAKYTPMGDGTYRILDALGHGPKHGYAISQWIEEETHGQTRVAVGNLYVNLKRLLDDGLIERAPVAAGEERRKVYRLSDLGREVLGAEQVRMSRLLSSGRRYGAAAAGMPI